MAPKQLCSTSADCQCILNCPTHTGTVSIVTVAASESGSLPVWVSTTAVLLSECVPVWVSTTAVLLLVQEYTALTCARVRLTRIWTYACLHCHYCLLLSDLHAFALQAVVSA